MIEKLNNDDRGNKAAGQEWLAGLMWQRDSKVLSRFVFYYRNLQQRPRQWRRLLQRKLAITVTGAALLLALAGGPIAWAEPIDTQATIAVSNGEVAIVNNGKCSLWEAIINARATTNNQMRADCTTGNINGPDTVSLPNGGDFVMTAPHNSQFGPTGLPVITTAMTIEGNGATIRRSTTSGTPDFRIMVVDPGVNLTLRNTTIRDGRAYEYDNGGGILSFGNLVIENSTIANNVGYAGGGIDATQATITGSRIIDNRACLREQYCVQGVGGGLNAGNLTLINSTVAGNIAFGGEEWSEYGGGEGGGIALYGNSTIIGSTITGNRAIAGWDSYNGSYPVSGLGGGISIKGDVTIVNSTISNNEANDGGGIRIRNGSVALIHSTLTGNNAKLTTQQNEEYTYTTGGLGGGILVGQESPYAEGDCAILTMRGVVISGNTAAEQGRELFVAAKDFTCTPTAIGNASNLIGRSASAGVVGFTPGPTDIVPSVGLSAILSPLADNGGPTMTHALPPGSPALDRAPSSSCTAAPVNGIDQRGQARNANGAGAVTNNECDAGSFELQAGGGGGAAGAFLVSPAGSGQVGGVAFVPADILKYDPAAGWSMYFDGSDVGITKNLAAFEVLGNGHILMSFAANQPTPAGTFAPQDIARFVPTATGLNTTGSFQWAFDGSANLLATTGEKIDALGDAGGGRTALSTTGAAAVKLPNGTVLKAQDEDALGLVPATGAWSTYFDGTPIPGLSGEDINAMWVDPATGDLYVSILGAFNLGGTRGNGKDIVKLTKSAGAPGGYVASIWWAGAAGGFPTTIDGLEILP